MRLRDQIGNILEENCWVVVRIGDKLIPARIREVHGGLDLAGATQQAPYLLLSIMYPVGVATADGLVLDVFRVADQHQGASNLSGNGPGSGGYPAEIGE